MIDTKYSNVSLKRIHTVQQHLPHALLLDGQPGVGLLHIAKEIGGKDVVEVIQPTNANGDIDEVTGSIKIKQIRALHNATRSKSRGRIIVIIDNADTMMPQAQNAFLKLLEEPNAHVHFILTSHASHVLLPTIRSRVQQVVISPISLAQSNELLDELGVHDTSTRTKMLFLAAGKPAQLIRYHNNQQLFERDAEFMIAARSLLSGSTVERLKTVQRYSDDRDASSRLLTSAAAILERSLHDHPSNATAHKVDAILTAHQNVRANANIRLQLLSLVI